MPPKTKDIAKKAHTHGCQKCLRRFIDDCATPHEAATCSACVAGTKPYKAMVEGYEPRDCCRMNARLADKDVYVTYSLSKAVTWYFCPVCSRCHAYDPRSAAAMARDENPSTSE